MNQQNQPFQSPMEQMEQQQQQEQQYYNIPQGDDPVTMWDDHLDATELIKYIQMMLLGFEQDQKTQQWVRCNKIIAYKEKEVWSKGKKKLLRIEKVPITVPEDPLMDPSEVRVVVSYLQMHLNKNTFLSKIKEESINNIMFDANIKLGKMFYKLRHKLQPHVRDLIWGMIDDSMYIGLNRADGKITLDAVSKTQHSIEHIQANQQQGIKQNEPKSFKLFGM